MLPLDAKRARRPVRWWAACAVPLSLMASAALAQTVATQVPQVTAKELGVPPPVVNVSPDAVVRVFIDACISNEGEPQAVVDWALNKGFEPIDSADSALQDQYLAGRSGTVLTMPGSGQRVVLVAAQDANCMVWSDRSSGPKMRAAFLQNVHRLSGGGAKLQTMLERDLQRAGAWRHQVQMKYRRVGGAQDFGIGAITTLNEAPGTQALNFAPLPPTAPRDPDGIKAP